MISDTLPIEHKTNEERGFPADSYFFVMFRDGSSRCEKNTNWSSFSEMKTVSYFGKKKQVAVSKLPIAYIVVNHDGMEVELPVPEDCEVYQAFYSEVSFLPDGKLVPKINGRCVGLVRNGEVVEEKFLNNREGAVYGVRL